MTSLGLLFVMGWIAGIVVTGAGLQGKRPMVTAVGAVVFVSTVITWLAVVLNQ